MKRYFVGYTEPRQQLLLSETGVLKHYTSFSRGVWVSYYSGHQRKRDALEYVKMVNKACGKTVAFYHGAIDVKRGDEYMLPAPESEQSIPAA